MIKYLLKKVFLLVQQPHGKPELQQKHLVVFNLIQVYGFLEM